MNTPDFQRMKNDNKKISMVTCYEYWSAYIISKSNVDCILVGDSIAMVMYGHATTLPATVDMIAQHVQAVSKGAPNKFIIGDMPFCSYRKNLTMSMNAIEKLMQSGAQAIKLEGADDSNLKLIRHVVKSGIPVMGHIGLTPQSVHAFGGFKVQGKEQSAAEKLVTNAKTLAKAGCFAVVLECVASELAELITDSISIPTIGIGAGPATSGQVLVLQDLLGMNDQFKPKYLKKFLNGFELIKEALNSFDNEVKTALYPHHETHGY
ncbi:3-methyl-2-oxobutanoate hydroxymethyltransferase [Coxiella endosymbiont of Ornithodoros amblus]|uniref:3-methyl-2-oxobutanoate hydroxymethyltransferase n=1 Tax=Coxiella endosymbiont of Ornithodoros amblus TaxID=1656166 RepID=UPI00244DFDD1|nr:3-methyl-2-oxobutanoate hydroxymethyltransferase [Coxiella endosymbiont of Ornithodoros amblus]MBW5802677.1 3-methyl-2-oxobutanoate hydroxymethyltransferase [Coxiella endosymbiont of Ornithodoros amblus]